MLDLFDVYRTLEEEIAIDASAEGVPRTTAFFNLFAKLAADNGDCPDLEYSPIQKGDPIEYRLDGYAFETSNDLDDISGDLFIATCVYLQNKELASINSKAIEKAVNEVQRFLKLVLSNRSLDDLEEASDGFKLAMLIRDNFKKISRVRLLVFTNAHLKVRKKSFETLKLGPLSVHINVFDIERYSKMIFLGSDPVELNFEEDFSGVIPCLPASTNKLGYKSYLFAISGSILAEIYATYGNRLLEQNVRTYLQAKTAVNKGILKTISEEPGMFFAYNNGLTATASAVTLVESKKEAYSISYIKDFQIVNGGQTTASVLYARDGLKYDLEDVYVQVKLSVVEEEKLDEIIPLISRYANTQNKVNESDLTANSAAQIRIERLSKEVVWPQKLGSIHVTKWFYERSRGQYRNLFSYKTPAQRNRLEIEFPKSQLIEKTDLAKFELSFDGRPHHVSEGAQKCFHRYVNTVLQPIRDVTELTESWFKCAVAKAILFRKLDKEISQASWYKENKGLKAQTVTYTIAACAQAFRDIFLQIDLLRIWKEQDVAPALLNWMLAQAQMVQKILSTPPGKETNPGQFCKQAYCWNDYVKGKVSAPTKLSVDYGVPLAVFHGAHQGGLNSAPINEKNDFTLALTKLVPRANEIRVLANANGLMSDKNSSALRKIEAGTLNLSRSEINALKNLLDRLEITY